MEKNDTANYWKIIIKSKNTMMPSVDATHWGNWAAIILAADYEAIILTLAVCWTSKLNKYTCAFQIKCIGRK